MIHIRQNAAVSWVEDRNIHEDDSNEMRFLHVLAYVQLALYWCGNCSLILLIQTSCITFYIDSGKNEVTKIYHHIMFRTKIIKKFSSINFFHEYSFSATQKFLSGNLHVVACQECLCWCMSCILYFMFTFVLRVNYPPRCLHFLV